jgi:hypothetical protein
MTSEGSEQVGVVTRPWSIVWFERIAWAALVVNIALLVANWTMIAKLYSKYPTSFPIMIVCMFAIQLLWIWLIARRRKNWARWTLVVVMLYGITSSVLNYDKPLWANATAEVANYLTCVIWLVAISLLFRSDASEWLSRKSFASVPNSSAQ